MASPSEEDLARVREAVGKVVSAEQLRDFDDGDVSLLWSQKYRTEQALRASSREQLTAIGLPGALVDYLKPAGEYRHKTAADFSCYCHDCSYICKDIPGMKFQLVLHQ
jgi:hypothetical protein